MMTMAVEKQNLKFLLIHHNPELLSTLEGYLVSLGHLHFFSVSTMGQAMQIFNNDSIDCILCDDDMPHETSYALLKLIKQQERFRKTGFLMFAATLENKEKIKKTAMAGVDRYLLLPCELEPF